MGENGTLKKYVSDDSVHLSKPISKKFASKAGVREKGICQNYADGRLAIIKGYENIEGDEVISSVGDSSGSMETYDVLPNLT